MRQPMVAGNWKMNGSLQVTADLVNGVRAGVGNAGNVEIVVCPPALYLQAVANAVSGSDITFGGQNLDYHDSGAYTGEISGAMLADIGAKYVIVGHSERRAYYAETNEIVGQKTGAALKHGLVPIVCVGETLEERESDRTEAVVGEQLRAVVDAVGISAFTNIVVAYEPVWAIGTGKTASPDQAQSVHEFIRAQLAAADSDIATGVRILYGGSVKPDNAADLFANADIDGGLIGGASLDANDFLAICRAAA